MKLICIPAYNEEANIGKLIKDCKKFADKVIVCDDGSIDYTSELAKKEGAIVLQHEKNQGYGSAIATCLLYTSPSPRDRG